MFGHKSFLRLGELSNSSIVGLYREGYELAKCSYVFSQGTNSDGKPQTEVHGGTINVSIPGLPPEDVILWMLTHRRYNDGTVVICDTNDIPLSKIHFKTAACVGMNISYSRKGQKYISTDLTLQARQITVGETTLNSRWTGFDELTAKSYENRINNTVNDFFRFPQIDSDLEVWFVFEGKEYEVEKFNIYFKQSVDHKGQPQEQVRGGRMFIALTQTVPEDIYKWAMKSVMQDGSVEFRSKTASSPLKVEFKKAYCVNFERVVDSGGGVTTIITISPADIIINGIDFYNNWTGV